MVPVKRGGWIVGGVIVGGVILAGVGCAAVLRGLVHGHRSRVFGRAVRRGPGRRRSVALTFDDGPSPGTLPLLEYLAGEGIRATFFQCGLNILRHREIAERVRDAGHEIGNHTFAHGRIPPQLSRRPNLRSPREIYRDLERTQAILKSVTGVAPTLFRPPYGLRWFGLGRAQEHLGLQGVLWTVIGHDWEWPGARVARHVLERVRPGGILCLHDGRDIQQEIDMAEMLSAVKMIVPALQRQGYCFETVSELLKPDVA